MRPASLESSRIFSRARFSLTVSQFVETFVFDLIF